MTLPVPMGSKDEAGHVHQWKRYPVVTLSITYGCEGCGKAWTVIWIGASEGTIEDFDARFIQRFGGEFAGEKYPMPSPEENWRRFAGMADLDPDSFPRP